MLIARQNDVRSNMKKYLDMAYNGEPVIIPRKHDQNVVIISESEYNRLSQQNRIAAYADAIGKRSAAGDLSDNVKIHNLRKLDSIRSFKDNWNGNGAAAFSPFLLDRIGSLIEELSIQPEIFPTALGTVQLEYDNARRDHMEIEIGEADTAEVFIVSYNGNEHFENIQVLPVTINERVRSFYG